MSSLALERGQWPIMAGAVVEGMQYAWQSKHEDEMAPGGTRVVERFIRSA